MKKDYDLTMVTDLFEQIQAVDRLLNMYAQEENDVVMASMIRQHSVRKQEFVDQLNVIFNKYALTINTLEKAIAIKAKKVYKNEALVAAVAEEAVDYNKGK